MELRPSHKQAPTHVAERLTQLTLDLFARFWHLSDIDSRAERQTRPHRSFRRNVPERARTSGVGAFAFAASGKASHSDADDLRAAAALTRIEQKVDQLADEHKEVLDGLAATR